jgi:hypothetical protein
MGGKGDRKKQNKSGQAARSQQQQQPATRRNLAFPGGTQAGPSPVTAATGSPPASIPAPQVPPSPRPAKSTQPSSRHYVDIAAVRIQEWLGRTPDLRFRRGASVLLSKATARKEWELRLPAGTRWNDEAGSVDGVVSLVFDPTIARAADTPAVGTLTDVDPAKVLADAARMVAQSMRKTMPHCPIQAVNGTGATYAAAYQVIARKRRDGDFLVDSPPAPAEVILAKPCDQCRAAAATKDGIQVVQNEREQALCAECNARFEAAGKSAGRPIQAPEPERWLKKALNDAGMQVSDFSDSFADMARAGQRDRDDASTQLALIYADGNKVGNFLATVAKTQGGPDKATIVPLIQQAALGALAQAVVDRFSGWTQPPVLVNLAGGDDLLVSVPAADSWLFTKTLLTAFTAILGKHASTWPREVRETIPTLSAGLVFHHAKYPFSDVARLAAEQLSYAKGKTPGTAAVAFLDLTADGIQPPKGRQPISLADLNKYAAVFQKTADLPSSRRQTLLDLERNDPEGFIKRLTDFDDNRPLWEIAAGRGADPRSVRDELLKDEGAWQEVRRAVDIARHWQTAPRTTELRQESEQRR